MLSKAYLSIFYISNEIDHQKAGTPYESSLMTDLFDISVTTFQRIYYEVKNTIYETDEGYLFSDIRTDKFMQPGLKNIYMDFRGQGMFPETFSTLVFSMDKYTDQYYRNYIKLQGLAANIGGVVNGIMIIGKLIIVIYTKKLNIHNLISSLIDDKKDKYTSSLIQLSDSNPVLHEINHKPKTIGDSTNPIKIEKPKKLD
jgi:hypothetical protein